MSIFKRLVFFIFAITDFSFIKRANYFGSIVLGVIQIPFIPINFIDIPMDLANEKFNQYV